MKFKIYKNVANFIKNVEPVLLEKEAEHNLIIGLLNRLMQGEINADNCFMAVFEKNEQFKYILLQTPPYNLIVGTSKGADSSEIPTLIKHLKEKNLEFPGVTAISEIAKVFAASWEANYRSKSVIIQSQGIYQLEKLKGCKLADGQMRVAVDKEIDTIAEWIEEFYKSTPHKYSREECIKLAKDMIKKKIVHVWENGAELVSMAAKNRETKNGYVISCVYTPPNRRGHGFATSVVHQLSVRILQEKKFCFLYTDLSNPTSNYIYQQIGYQFVKESAMYYLSSDL